VMDKRVAAPGHRCITAPFLVLLPAQLTSRSAFGYRNAADAAIMPG
jgi:hypothetical protein